MAEEEFEVASAKRGGSANNKRVYIGNLPNTFSSQQALQESLQQWIHEQIPNLSIESLQVNVSGRSKYPHALLDCGAQANQVVRSLHQQTFQGQRVTVQREKRNNNNNNNNNTKDGGNVAKKKGFGGKGWAAPPPAPTPSFTQVPVDQATLEIQSVVEEEFKLAEENGEDAINVALASTAATTLFAAMNAFGGDVDEPIDDNNTPISWEHKTSANDNDDNVQESEPAEFIIKPMADLLADFGKADPNWMKVQIDTSAQTASGEDATNSQLAQKGKAPIHICFTSFGFSKGAPKRMDGWSYRQPLLPFDCREYPTVPGYLAWQDGLSAVVKRALQYPQDHDRRLRGKDKDAGEAPPKTLHNYACKELAPQVWDVLVDAQNEGGHGYMSPLEMTIYIGSESGRHRSVVACEWAATQMRKFLRTNANNAIRQPVSVGTFHRDVDTSRQQQYNLKKSDKGKNDNTASGKSVKKQQMEMAGDW